MEMRSSLAWSRAPELNGGEGAGPSSWGVSLKSGKAPGPAHGERGGVRWLSTDGVAENRGEHGGDGLPEADRKPIARTTSKTKGSIYSHASHGSNMSLRKERGREVTVWHGGRAVSWTQGVHPGVHAARRGAPAHCYYSATRAWAALRRGLDGALSAASAWPVGQAARSFIVELLARASQLA
jgi:hypothetical protein